ncbi:MAG TPA: efflux RND transporter periplasmic adaptor subunit [Methylococcaceae bacterium]|nr:efflux RND transporter periplasmic adaptor subunit [Methylococcaceae bacterium]
MKRLAFCFWACLATAASAGETVAVSDEQAQLLGIVTAAPQSADKVPQLRAPARVVLPPQQEYVVSATQAGLVSRVAASAGEKVAAGQTLALLASPAFLALQRDYLHAVREHHLADSQVARDRRLLDAGAIPQRRYQETGVLHDKHSASDDEARQVLRLAGMNEDEIDALRKTAKLSDTLSIRAPFAGVVLENMAAAGRQVDQLAPLFRIANLDRLWLEIHLPQEQAAAILDGDLVEAGAARGKITAVNRQVDPATQSVPARAEVENAHDDLRPGQMLEAEILRPAGEPVFSLPAAALTHHGAGAFVFVRVATGFEARSVEMLGRREATVFVRGALSAADRIAVQGVAALKARWTEADEGE